MTQPVATPFGARLLPAAAPSWSGVRSECKCHSPFSRRNLERPAGAGNHDRLMTLVGHVGSVAII